MKWLRAFGAVLLIFGAIACSQAAPAEQPVSTETPAPAPTQAATFTPTPTVVLRTPSAIPSPTAISLPPPQTTSMSRGAHEGQPAPDFEFMTFDGQPFRLSDHVGEVVVLNFWASWCPPCRWEMPHFEEIWLEYQEQGVILVGVAISDFEEDAKAFSDATGVTYPVGLDTTAEIARSYQPSALPTTFFIDKEGNVARRLSNVANQTVLRLFIEGQLRESG
jgi:peroxiredoxin